MKVYIDSADSGGTARIRVLADHGPVKVSASVEGRVVYEHECPDPPCHEEFALGSDLGGAVLEVVAFFPDGRSVRAARRIERRGGGAQQQMGSAF